MSESDVVVGSTYSIVFPFTLERGIEVPPDDPEAMQPAIVDSWRPGVEFDTDDHGRTSAAADANGEMRLTVIDIHRPGKFPTRVFYTRQWVAPTGKVFGKANLRITTLQAFKRRLRGYKHEYELSGVTQ